MHILFLVLAATQPYKTHVCKNGLTVLVAENHAEPLVTIEIGVKNGAMTESPEYNGLSHLYEHMFFKANAVLPNQEAYLERARELGMVWNGTTSDERVNYFFTTTSDHLQDAMVFMRDAVVSPLFDEKELERERVVVTGEIDRNEANPMYHFYHTLNQHVWWKYPSRKDALGNRQTVLTATREKMQTIQHRYYVPNNSLLVVTGDVKADDIFAASDALYANWKKADDPFKKFPLVKHPPLPKTDVVVVEQPVQSVTGAFVWLGPSVAGKEIPATYAADVLGAALQNPGGQFQKAVVDAGACVRANLGWQTAVNTGPIILSFEAAPEKVDACIAALQKELPRVANKDYFSDEALKNAAFHLQMQRVREREKPSELAHIFTFWWASGGLDYYDSYLDKVRAVSRGDIAALLKKYVYEKPYIMGVMASPEMKLSREHFLSNLGGAR